VPIELVVFDIAGTLVEDHDEVTSAFHAALTGNGVSVSREELREWKGGAKREVIRRFVERQAGGPNDALVESTFADFRNHLEHEYVAGLKPIAGAAEAVMFLRDHGVKTATITGFYRQLRDAILDRLRWRELFDAHVSSDDVPSGRPAPYLVFHAMEATGTTDVRRVMVVGDTPLDLQAANNAGTIAVAVLTGVHPRSRLERERYSHIIESVADVPALVRTYS
jgi:phosphonatase-like hydrolase